MARSARPLIVQPTVSFRRSVFSVFSVANLFFLEPMMKRILALTTAVALAFAPAAALAQTKISTLPAGSGVSASDVFPATQGTCPTSCATNAVTAAQIKTFAQAGLAASATSDTTNAGNITAGTLAAARGGAGTITGALKGNGSGVVSQAAAADLSNGVTGSGAVALATSPSFTTPSLGVATVTTLAGAHAITSVTPGAAAQVGTGATAACTASHTCTSLSGQITLTTGTGTPATGGAYFTITFADTRTNIPNCVVGSFQKSGPAFGSNSLWDPGATTSTLAVTGVSALTASTAYTVDYECGGN